MRTQSPDTRVLHRTALGLGLQAAALVAATVIALIALASAVVIHAQHTAGEALLRAAAARADDVGDPPADVWLTIVSDGYARSTPGIPAGLPDLADITRVGTSRMSVEHHITIDHRDYRVLTTATKDGVVQAALDLRATHAERGRLITALLAGGLLGLVMAVGIGTLLGRRAVRPMSDALALKRRFVADASHELNTPLTLLSTRAQLLHRSLVRTGAGNEITEDAEGVVTDSRHLADVVQDLLTAADPRSPIEAVDLGELVTTVAASCYAYAEERQTRLVVAGDLEPIIVDGQGAALRRALTALVDNAIEHSPAQGRVVLAVKPLGKSRVEVTVTDEGEGVDPAKREALLTRFHSDAEVVDRRRYGLGLALADDVVTRHGGRLGISPAPNGPGSVFSLVLPRLAVAGAAAGAGHRRSGAGRRRWILSHWWSRRR